MKEVKEEQMMTVEEDKVPHLACSACTYMNHENIVKKKKKKLNNNNINGYIINQKPYK
jgi:Zn ribbon nucleic-acid-binding protein